MRDFEGFVPVQPLRFVMLGSEMALLNVRKLVWQIVLTAIITAPMLTIWTIGSRGRARESLFPWLAAAVVVVCSVAIQIFVSRGFLRTRVHPTGLNGWDLFLAWIVTFAWVATAEFIRWYIGS